MDNNIFLKVSSKTLAKWLRSRGFEHCLVYCTYFMTEKGNAIERFVFIKEDSSESIITANNVVYGFFGCMKNLENLAPGKQPEFNVYCTVEDACREMCRAFAGNRAIELYGAYTEPNLLEVGNLTEEMAKIEIDIAIRRGDRHGK